jgi:hypothetical protein
MVPRKRRLSHAGRRWRSGWIFLDRWTALTSQTGRATGALGNDYPEWMADPIQRVTHLFETAKGCCDLWFKDESVACQNYIAISSSGDHVGGPLTFGGTWYPSLNGKYECLDGDPPAWMEQEGYEAYYIFDSHAGCCKAHYCQDIRGIVNS